MDWKITRRFIEAWWKDSKQFSRRKIPRDCPVCGYHGTFLSVGRPSRWDVRCPKCASRNRHRLMWLYFQEAEIDPSTMRILNFGPEKCMIERMRDNPNYETADLHAKIARFRLDITDIDRPDDYFDMVIAHHVLEHVDDDRKAMRELCRVTRPGGIAAISVPLDLTRERTYENPAITDLDERFVHFGGTDHKRYYARDFGDRLAEAGFEVTPYRRDEPDEVRYSLTRGQQIYICHKPG